VGWRSNPQPGTRNQEPETRNQKPITDIRREGMKSYRRWMAVTILLALVATGAVVSAQDKQSDKPAKAEPKVERDVLMRTGGVELLPRRQGPEAAGTRMWFGDEGTTIFIASEMLSGDRAIKGAPYSAQAVTETIQTLADGNR